MLGFLHIPSTGHDLASIIEGLDDFIWQPCKNHLANVVKNPLHVRELFLGASIIFSIVFVRSTRARGQPPVMIEVHRFSPLIIQP